MPRTMRKRSLAALVALAASAPALAAVADEATVTESGLTYLVVDGTEIPEPLTGAPGDPERGREVFVDRGLGNCLGCHAVSRLADEPFHGDVGPPLDGVGDRRSAGELRLQVVDPKALNPDSVMPAFFKTAGLVGVADKYEGETILTAEQVEDVVAFLGTLKE